MSCTMKVPFQVVLSCFLFGLKPPPALAKGRVWIRSTKDNPAGFGWIRITLHHGTVKVHQRGIPRSGRECSLVDLHVVPCGMRIIPCLVGFSRLEGQDELPRIRESQVSLLVIDDSDKTVSLEAVNEIKPILHVRISVSCRVESGRITNLRRKNSIQSQQLGQKVRNLHRLGVFPFIPIIELKIFDIITAKNNI